MIIFQRSKFRQLLRPSRPSCALEVETVFFDNLVNWNVFRWQRHPCHGGQAILCIYLAREGDLFLHFNSLAGFKVEAFCVWRFNIEFLFVNELVLHLTLTLGDWLCDCICNENSGDWLWRLKPHSWSQSTGCPDFANNQPVSRWQTIVA